MVPLASKSAWKDSREPHWDSICDMRGDFSTSLERTEGALERTEGALERTGALNWEKYRLWFRIWPALLKMGPAGALATISSRERPSYSVPAMSLFRLST